MSDYTPPKIWTWKQGNGGQFANINRPVAGSTHDKDLPVGKHPFQLYSMGTPNGQKVTIMFEELIEAGHTGAEYDAWTINIGEGEQFTSGFVGVNPNNPSQQTTYEQFDAVASLHIPIFVDGKLVYEVPTLQDVRAYAKSRVRTIRLESRRLENPHTLKVSLTDRYWKFKLEIADRAKSAEELS